MLTARSVIIAVVTVAVLSLLGVVYSLAQPPDSGGMGHDTYGTRAYGQRALYEILEELHFPVERGLVPPESVARSGTCVVFWNPDATMVQLEPAHLGKVAEWVRGGGKLIVAPAYQVTSPRRVVPMPGVRATPYSTEVSLLDELGLAGVVVTWFDPVPAGTAKPGPVPAPPPRTPFGLPREKVREFCDLAVTAEGAVKGLGSVVTSLRVPAENLHVIAGAAGPVPAGRLLYTESDGKVRTLAATYPLGDGEITLVGDPSLFLNECIARDDNAVLAVHLFHRAGRRIVFDEFYHGLTVRGNPAWLLTRHPYGMFAALLVAACLLWAWREAVHLGPPLREKPVSRRTMREYVEAMAGLFYRNGCRTFVLREVRDGALWALRRRLGLSPKRENVADLARVIERKDAEAAQRLRAAAAEVELVLSGKRPATEMAVVQAARKIEQCL